MLLSTCTGMPLTYQNLCFQTKVTIKFRKKCNTHGHKSVLYGVY